MNDVQCVQKIVWLQILSKVGRNGLYWNLKGLYILGNISFAIQNLITSNSFRKSFTLCIFIHVEFRTIKVWIDILQSRNSCRPEVDFFTVLNLSNEACPFIIPLRPFSMTLLKLTALCRKIEKVQTNDDCANLPKPERTKYK